MLDAGESRLEGRKVYFKGPWSPSSGDANRHGTIIAGIIGGNPVSGISTVGGATQGYGLKDSDVQGQFYYGLGVAPGIRVGSTRFYSYTIVGTPKDWTKSGVSSPCNRPTDLCGNYEACPAVAQNHSHNPYDAVGTNAGVYTVHSQEFDKSVRDADWDTPGHQPLAIAISAGNYRQQDESTTMAAGTAKNVITMGGAESRRDTPIPTTCLSSGENPTARHAAQGYNVVAYFSRRGTIDGRLKPDLLAPASQAMGPSSYVQNDYYCATAGDSSQANYPQHNGASGTSFAAPVAVGAIALLRYYYGVNYNFAPSPAMYKAMLVGGALSMTNALDRQTGGTVTAWPNAQQGYGLITLNDLLITAPKAWVDRATILTQGQFYQRTVTVADPSKPVRIVLAWTDAEAAAGAQITLVNHLDLSATWPDFYRLYGNYFDARGWSRTSAGCGRPTCPSPADSRNNVEVLHINPSRFADPANRTFTVRIMASPLNGIGVPGQSGGVNNQDFALFVMNGTLQ